MNRNHNISFRVNKDEYETIKQKAESVNMEVSSYIRFIATKDSGQECILKQDVVPFILELTVASNDYEDKEPRLANIVQKIIKNYRSKFQV